LNARAENIPAATVAVAIYLAAWPAWAQTTPPSWLLPDLLGAARAEGSLTIYSSVNEQEGLPLWQTFEDATGVKVSYVRSSDSVILARIAMESRARTHSWDIAVTTTVNRLPPGALAQFDPPQARDLLNQARDPERRWYGVYANYKDLVGVLKPVMVDGHLALARSVGAGEHWLALNNYASLTLNVRLSGAATDFWAMDPVALFFGSVAVSAQAPHPKAALLAANFILSREAQQLLAGRGRMPTRPDVPVNPPGVAEALLGRKIIATIFASAEQKRWQGLFKEIFGSR